MSKGPLNGTRQSEKNEYILVQSSVIRKVPCRFTVVVTHCPKEFYGSIRKRAFVLSKMIHSGSKLEV